MDNADGGRRGPRPRASAALIEGVAASYDVAIAAVTDLGGSANLNLLVGNGDERFVVRVYRRHVTDDRLNALQHARAHLAAHGVPCAVAVPARDGAGFVRVGAHLVEIEPFVTADAKMDSLDRIAAGLPYLARVHDRLVGLDLGDAAGRAPFANYVDPIGLVDAVRAGTDRIRTWRPTADELALAHAADDLAEAATAAHEPFRALPPQLVHGDFWDNNVLFRLGELVLIGDFDFMGERLRIDDLALTLSFTTYLLDLPLETTALERLRALVRRYDAATALPLTRIERAALPVALSRQSLWSIAVWAALLDNADTARRHLRGHRAAVEQGLWILDNLERVRDALQ